PSDAPSPAPPHTPTGHRSIARIGQPREPPPPAASSSEKLHHPACVHCTRNRREVPTPVPPLRRASRHEDRPDADFLSCPSSIGRMSQGFNKKWRMRWGCGRTPLRRGYLLPCVAWGITNGSSHPCVDESVADLLRRGALRHG